MNRICSGMLTNGAVLAPGVRVGQSYPLGATPDAAGVNFSVFSKNATAIDLLFFDAVDDPQPARVISLDPRANRTFHFWHVYVDGIAPGQLYAYRAHGPFDPARGLRFDPDKVLLDPYGKGVAIPAGYSREAATVSGNNAPYAMKSVVADPDRYDWEGDVPLKRPFVQTVIYEMHVKGFTAHPSSGVAPEVRGTYAGLIEKIPYLQHLGITAVELLPVFQFDATEAPPGLTNYWGYNPVSFFTPHLAYSSRQDPLGPQDEFRDMVKALHRAGIEVILDVVYNHTAESHDQGPTICFRGLENDDYYILEPDKARYADYSGTGNTLNTNHSTVRRLIMDSLRYWVEVMHVDGFRFDLASILSRDEDGRPLTNPPILWDIESDPVLAGTKLIAEAWDAAGLYQVGSFVGDQWKEWNGRFRDDVRSFFRGDEGAVKKLPDRFFASPDLYGHEEREPEQSINFVTCHDGFTLNDLVSYSHKHNEANGEDNRDGHNDNRSWNCGVEGPSDEPDVERLRCRQVKNFFVINLLALGVPMILMGDEMRRTQRGNNNAYCQDNEINWLDWRLLERYGDIHRFVRKMIRLRLSLDVFQQERGQSLNQFLQSSRIDWHGIKLYQPDWSDHSHSLAFTVQGRDLLFHIIFNAYREPLEFELPPLPSEPPAAWRRIIDTYRESPDDIGDMSRAPVVDGQTYCVQAHSVVLLARG
ncbi:MAG: glycogen debranching protein GlgX [Desulfobacterales bacterium]|nr:glycogen debranching protein GlgX [Desulfobacterales bacterium]